MGSETDHEQASETFIERSLVDRNNDGFPDDLDAQFVVSDALDTPTWYAVINLAARLGLSSSGFTPSLVTSSEQGAANSLTVQPGDAGKLERILADSLPDQTPLPLERRDIPYLDPTSVDLSQPWTINGFLVDRDGDQAGDDSALHITLPEQISPELGAALVDFACRIGIESGALCFPLAGDVPLEGRVTLRVEPDDSPTARFQWADRHSLKLTGSAEQIASLLDGLTTQSSGFCATRPIHDALEWLRRSAAGWTHEGIAAALRQALTVDGADGLVIHPAAAAQSERLIATARESLPAQLITVADLSESVVFDHQWSAEWEVDRLRKAFDEEILPKLKPGLPVKIVIMVSEPPAIRRRIRGQLSRRLLEHGITAGSLHVLDAFKPGLSWLMEVVLPDLRQQEDLSRINLGFRMWDPADHPGQLDMPIRWLQELFPADELLSRELGLPLDAVELEALHNEDTIYRCAAFDSAGNVLLRRDFDPFWRRIDYLSGMPEAGNVTVTTGGVIVHQGDNVFRSRVLTDPEVFWRYVQGELLPNLRRYILTRTGNQPTASAQPFFDELFIDLQISESDEPYEIREERHSAAEALHEDIYFNVLDFIEELGLSTTGENLGAPGSVRPFVSVVPGRQPNARIRLSRRQDSIARILKGTATSLVTPAASTLPALPRVRALELLGNRLVAELELTDELSELRGFLGSLARESPPADVSFVLRCVDVDSLEIGVPAGPEFDLPDRLVESEIPPDTIISNAELFPHLRRLAGRPGVDVVFAAERSYQGRPIPAVLLAAPQSAKIWSARKLSQFKPTLLVVARHHANEVASTTAALQLIDFVTSDANWAWVARDLNVVLLPIENPDGAALHDELRRINPTWKHHPARYNATGFEFSEDHANPDSPYGESRVRDLAWHACPPDIVVDNHGVPSHEWAQLFAGFGSPPRFGVSYWQVQAQIYGIIPWLELPDHREMASALRERVAQAIAADRTLLRYNRIYAERYRTWGHRWESERFPMDLTQEMIFHGGPLDPASDRAKRSFPVRYPNTTLVSWVTEVNDETVEGAPLERAARAHLLCNRAALELLQDSYERPQISAARMSGVTTVRTGRRRPISVNSA